MSPAGRIFLLARRDFLQRAKSRAFLIAMLITVGLVLAVGPILALAGGDDDPLTIGLVDPQPEGIDELLALHTEALGLDSLIERYGGLSTAEDALERRRIDVVIDGTTLVWRTERHLRLAAAIAGAYTQHEREATAAELGLSAGELGALLSPAQLTDRLLEEPDPDAAPRRAAAYIGLMVLYASILMFGQFVLMGVMEEKQNRVVEVVLSRVHPTQILAGKVLGVGLLGLIQIVVLGAAALLMANLVDIADVDLGSISLGTFVAVLFWYLLGYALYSVLYGSLGATVSRQEDMQGVVMLPVILIVPGFFFGNVAVETPDALLARVGSLVPLWSPMVMPVRSAVGDVPTWEIALSVVMVIAAVYGFTRLGGYIYKGAILKVGSRVRLRDAWRSARS